MTGDRIAMIRQPDHNCVLRQRQLIQRIQHSSDGGVGLIPLRIAAGEDLLPGGPFGEGLRALMGDFPVEDVTEGAAAQVVAEAGILGYVGRVDHVGVLGRWVIGLVRAPQADDQAEGLLPRGEFAQLLASQVGDELLFMRFRRSSQDARAVHKLPGRGIVQDDLLPAPIGIIDIVFD